MMAMTIFMVQIPTWAQPAELQEARINEFAVRRLPMPGNTLDVLIKPRASLGVGGN
jgi:hypothetical protein